MFNRQPWLSPCRRPRDVSLWGGFSLRNGDFLSSSTSCTRHFRFHFLPEGLECSWPTTRRKSKTSSFPFHFPLPSLEHRLRTALRVGWPLSTCLPHGPAVQMEGEGSSVGSATWNLPERPALGNAGSCSETGLEIPLSLGHPFQCMPPWRGVWERTGNGVNQRNPCMESLIQSHWGKWAWTSHDDRWQDIITKWQMTGGCRQQRGVRLRQGIQWENSFITGPSLLTAGDETLVTRWMELVSITLDKTVGTLEVSPCPKTGCCKLGF